MWPTASGPRRAGRSKQLQQANSRWVRATSRLATDDAPVGGIEPARPARATPARPAFLHLEPRHQFLEGERLDDVIVGARLEPRGAILDLGQGRQHDDGQPDALGPDHAHEVETAIRAEHHVDDGGRLSAVRDQLERGVGAMGRSANSRAGPARGASAEVISGSSSTTRMRGSGSCPRH